jgi:hypothetical protein
MIAALTTLLDRSPAVWDRAQAEASVVSHTPLSRLCPTLHEVEELLDWLESNGHPATELTCTDDGFVVGWIATGITSLSPALPRPVDLEEELRHVQFTTARRNPL